MSDPSNIKKRSNRTIFFSIKSIWDAFCRSPALHGVILGLFSLATAMILALVSELTGPVIAARGQEDLLASLTEVIPATLHDNDPSATLRTVTDDEGASIQVYVATQAGAVTGVAFELTGYGYSGAIRILIAIGAEGNVLGVRVLAHSETPGLGDQVEAQKSNWITKFTGRSLNDPAPSGWKVKKDGGSFDQFSGATITPRAVVATVLSALELFANNRDTLLAPFPTQTEDTD